MTCLVLPPVHTPSTPIECPAGMAHRPPTRSKTTIVSTHRTHRPPRADPASLRTTLRCDDPAWSMHSSESKLWRRQLHTTASQSLGLDTPAAATAAHLTHGGSNVLRLRRNTARKNCLLTSLVKSVAGPYYKHVIVRWLFGSGLRSAVVVQFRSLSLSLLCLSRFLFLAHLPFTRLSMSCPPDRSQHEEASPRIEDGRPQTCGRTRQRLSGGSRHSYGVVAEACRAESFPG